MILSAKQYPVLLHDEERELFEKMRQAQRAAKKLERIKDRTRSQSAQLGAHRRTASRCRTRLIHCNIRLVLAMSKKTWVTNLHSKELASQGMLTLINCVDKFDHTKGNKFSSYTVRALFNIFSRRSKKQQQHLDNTTDLVITAQDGSGDFATDPGYCDQGQRHAAIDVSLLMSRNRADLTDMEAFVIRLHYGLGDASEHNLTQIGQIINRTKERARQIRDGALKKLRKSLEKSP